jgi:hypothetical protein
MNGKPKKKAARIKYKGAESDPTTPTEIQRRANFVVGRMGNEHGKVYHEPFKPEKGTKPVAATSKAQLKTAQKALTGKKKAPKAAVKQRTTKKPKR